MNIYPYYLGNKPFQTNTDLVVTDKYSGEVIGRVATADSSVIDKAIHIASLAEEPMRNLASFERQAILYKCINGFNERSEELSNILCREAGKPIKDSRVEVSRLIDTFRTAAEESLRISGEVMPLDITNRSKNYFGLWKRFPIGVCAFISPFNFPLNLIAHKIAPAIAAGCPFVLKPSSSTPISAILIGEILSKSGLPEGAFSILPCRGEIASKLAEDDRIKLLSFTGSPIVGWELKKKAWKKRVILELGGNAGCIIDEDSNYREAVERVIFGAFYQSGQSCISVQRLFVHKNVYEEFKELFLKFIKNLKIGDPKKEDTFIGPLITEEKAKNLESSINTAVKYGAKILCGGKRNAAMLEPTVLENVSHDSPLYSEEVFGPIVVIEEFQNFDEAINEVNNSKYGLQAGIFTNNIRKIMKAWDKLEVGGVIINEVPSWRVDNMPYGGVKNSGFGREGVKFAIEEMTDIKLLALRLS